MAGVGFKLNKLFYKNQISTDVLAVIYSILTSSGPWIITTISLWVVIYSLKSADIYFNMAVIYAFILSIIFSGIFSMFLSRRTSDLIYSKKYEKILPETLSIILVNNLIVITYLIIFFLIFKHDIKFILSFSYLTTSLTTLWLISVSSLATDSINWYIFSYLTMGISSIILAKYFEIIGYAIAVNIGIIINVFVVIYYFGSSSKKISFEWFKEVKNYWQNLLIGFTYYLSIWIDDIIVWNHPKFGEEPISGFKFSYVYDSPMFFSYLTIIPTITMFILVLETRFYKKYKSFYNSLIEGYVLSEIILLKNSMEKELKQNISLTIKIQTLITTVFFILNELELLPFSNQLSKPILRLGLIGAMLNGFYLMMLLLILYFDFRNLALAINLSVLGLNSILSTIFVNKIGYAALGSGYAFSFAIGTFISYYLLKIRVNKIIQIEYSRQKVDLKEGYYLRLNEIEQIREELKWKKY